MRRSFTEIKSSFINNKCQETQRFPSSERNENKGN
jgi:hypothetical protein